MLEMYKYITVIRVIYRYLTYNIYSNNSKTENFSPELRCTQERVDASEVCHVADHYGLVIANINAHTIEQLSGHLPDRELHASMAMRVNSDGGDGARASVRTVQ